MDPEAVTIERGLHHELRDQAVDIFDDAFGSKMRTIVRDAEKRKSFMRGSFVAEHCVVARRDETLLGLAGLKTRGVPYGGGLMGGSWDPRPFLQLLGWVGAPWAVWGTRLGEHRPRGDEIYVDGIAVAPDARGLGIGTRLLDEIALIGRELGKGFVRLHVMDTNPRAQALYERVGYRVTRVQSSGHTERWLGFGGIIWMELPVPPTAADGATTAPPVTGR